MISAASEFLDAADLTRTAPQNEPLAEARIAAAIPAIPRRSPPPSPPRAEARIAAAIPPAPLPRGGATRMSAMLTAAAWRGAIPWRRHADSHLGRYAQAGASGRRSSSKGRTQQRERLRRASSPREKRGARRASGEQQREPFVTQLRRL